MPLYEYVCGSCDHQFSDVLKVDDRKKPCDEDCPNCDSKGHISMKVSSARIVSGVGTMQSRTPTDFRDRLKEIKKMSGVDCTIET